MNDPPSVEREVAYRESMGALLDEILTQIRKREAKIAVIQERIDHHNGQLADLCRLRDGIEETLAINVPEETP